MNSDGDVVIENGHIRIVVGDDHLRQKVWMVLGTNLREWFFDWDQGIDFGNLLGKGENHIVSRFCLCCSRTGQLFTDEGFE